MRASVRTTVPPAAEPVTLAEAKAELRVEHALDDGRISGLLARARDAVERAADRRLVTQTVEVQLAGFPAEPTAELALPVGPCQAVSQVRYRPAAGGAEATLTGWRAWAAHDPPLVGPPATGWPEGADDGMAAVTVLAAVGYGGQADVPAAAKQAILLAVRHWYGFGDDQRAADPHALPPGCAALIELFRLRRYA